MTVDQIASCNFLYGGRFPTDTPFYPLLNPKITFPIECLGTKNISSILALCI